MQTTTARSMPTSARSSNFAGIVYHTVCQNPGCSHTFDLTITAKDAGLLGGTMTCPRCKRHGGMLKSAGRIGDKLFAAKLVFKSIGTGPGAGASSEDGDLVSELFGQAY